MRACVRELECKSEGGSGSGNGRRARPTAATRLRDDVVAHKRDGVLRRGGRCAMLCGVVLCLLDNV